MNKLKTWIGLLAVAALIVLQPMAGYAAGPTGPVGPTEPVGVQGEIGPQAVVSETNSQTGAESENVNSVAATGTETTATVDNEANINNANTIDLNSGNNNIGSSTVVGNVSTGDANGLLNVLNVGNSEFAEGSSVASSTLSGGSGNVDLTNPSQSISIAGLNSETGAGSANTNQVDNSNIVEVFQQNTANANNDIILNADTGTNTISGNTKIGDLTTGDINLGVNLINLLNIYRPDLLLTVDLWNILGDLNGDLLFDDSLANTNTGSDSSNLNQVTNQSGVDVNIDQTANITNNLEANTNTGNNELSMNTVAGAVATGATTVKNSLSNLANISTPAFYLLNVFGDWDGNLLGLDPNRVIVNVINDLTGSGSENNNNVATDGTTEINFDNEANVSNNVLINANTGRNKLDHNTIVGNIKTGSINVSANVVNVLNSLSSNLSSFKLGIINIFGNWKGNGRTKSSKSEPPVTPPVNNGGSASTDIPPAMGGGESEIASDVSESNQSVLGVQKINAVEATEPVNSSNQEVLGVSAENPDSGLPTKFYLGIIIALISLILLTYGAIRQVQRQSI